MTNLRLQMASRYFELELWACKSVGKAHSQIHKKLNVIFFLTRRYLNCTKVIAALVCRGTDEIEREAIVG